MTTIFSFLLFCAYFYLPPFVFAKIGPLCVAGLRRKRGLGEGGGEWNEKRFSFSKKIIINLLEGVKFKYKKNHNSIDN